jgi:diguanylate cyclase (GGDEF)-like protein
VTASAILILAIAIQQALFAVFWWVGASNLRLSRLASGHWGAFCIANALAMLGYTDWARASLGSAGVFARNALMVLAALLLRRGLLCFFHQPLRDREQVGVYAAYLLALAWLGSGADATQGRTVALSLVIAWVAWRCGMELLTHVGAEYGHRVARTMALPVVAMGALLFTRAALAVLKPQSSAMSMNDNGSFNLVMLLSLVVLLMLFHFALGYLVTLRLVGKLQHLSRHDALTGLFNRRAFEDRLAQEVAANRRTALPLGLLMVDIDHFKAINDRHGHHGGDEALRAVAERLRQAARTSDVVGRLGGEEFSVLLPATDAAGIRQAAERLRLAVATQALQLSADPTGAPAPALAVTVSVGASMLLPTETDGQDLLRRADQALYRAKAEGRNRVVVDTLAGVAPAPVETNRSA